MDQFIESASDELGVSQETGTAATKGLLGLLRDQMDDDAFGQLAGALPGVGALLGGDAKEEGGALGGLGGGLGGSLGGMLGGATGGGSGAGGGALGGLGGGLGGMLGGAMGDMGGLGAVMQLASSGLDKEQLGTFVQLFLNYVQSEAGQEMVAKIVQSVPALKAVLG